jgi:multiple sugar transport system permease protein
VKIIGKRTSPARIATLVILVLWSIICLFPIYWLAITSLKTEADIGGPPVYFPFLDFMPTLASWSFILFDRYENVLASGVNSLIVAAVSTALTMLIASLATYAITRLWTGSLQGWGGRLFAAALSTRLLPPFVLVVPIYVMAQASSLLDSRTLLIIIYAAINLPVALWLLRPVFGSRVHDQEEAALLDGASHLQILFGVLIPMTVGGVFAAGFIVFLLCWNEYIFAATLATNHATTLPPFLVSQMSMKEAQVGGEAEEWAHFSAAALLMAIPLLAATTMAQRALAGIAVRR